MKIDNPEVACRLKSVRKLAHEYGWTEIDRQDNIGMVSFSRPYNGEGARMNIYLTRMTVATCLNHPKQGKTQLFLRGAEMKDVRRLMKNPRQHTRRRYHKREEIGL